MGNGYLLINTKLHSITKTSAPCMLITIGTAHLINGFRTENTNQRIMQTGSPNKQLITFGMKKKASGLASMLSDTMKTGNFCCMSIITRITNRVNGSVQKKQCIIGMITGTIYWMSAMPGMQRTANGLRTTNTNIHSTETTTC